MTTFYLDIMHNHTKSGWQLNLESFKNMENLEFDDLGILKKDH